MDQSLQMSLNFDEIVKMFDSRMQNYEDRLKKLSPSCAAPPLDLKSLTSEFLDFKTFVWKTLTLMKSQVEMLTLGLERHETYMRRKVLLIHGVAEEKNEKLSNAVHNILSSRLELSEVSPNEIQVCHRLGVQKGRPRPILIRFNNINTRQLVWSSKTLLKGSGITISEFLTKSKHQVFMEARKHFGINCCWTSDGKIVVLLPDKTRRKIEVLSDLRAIMTKYPSSSKMQELSVQSVPKNAVKEKEKPPLMKSPRKVRRKL